LPKLAADFPHHADVVESKGCAEVKACQVAAGDASNDSVQADPLAFLQDSSTKRPADALPPVPLVHVE